MNRRHFLSASLTLGAGTLLSRFAAAGAPAQNSNRAKGAQAPDLNSKAPPATFHQMGPYARAFASAADFRHSIHFWIISS